MLDRNNPRIMAILREFHKKVGQKTRRFERASDDIMRENMVLQLLCRKNKLSPAACAEEIFAHFGYGCTVEDMITVYRDYKINTSEKRMEVFTRAMELASLLEKAMHGGKQVMEEYKKGFKAFLSYEHIKRPQRYSRIVLASVFFVIPELQYEDDQDAVLNLGDTLSKYLLYDLENAINAAYKGAGSSQSDYRQQALVPRIEHERVLQKLAQLESALEQSNMLLEDLQNEFDERLEAVKVQEMSEFFGKLNSDRYGCILDELLTLRKGVELMRKNGYDLPLELNGLLIMVKKLVRACENQLLTELNGFSCSGGRKVNANIQAIYALGCFGKPEEVEKLLKLVTMPKYYTQCLYAFGKAKIEGKLLYEKFSADVYYQSARSNLQVTAQALAMALRLDNGKRAEGIDVVQVIKDLCFVLEKCAVLEPAHASGHVCSLVALAYACDQRYGNNPLPQESLEMVDRTLKNLNRNYSAEVMKHLVKSANVVRKMLAGEGLSLAEEQFLLKKLDV